MAVFYSFPRENYKNSFCKNIFSRMYTHCVYALYFIGRRVGDAAWPFFIVFQGKTIKNRSHNKKAPKKKYCIRDMHGPAVSVYGR
jgi:hypothetical protein